MLKFLQSQCEFLNSKKKHPRSVELRLRVRYRLPKQNIQAQKVCYPQKNIRRPSHETLFLLKKTDFGIKIIKGTVAVTGLVANERIKKFNGILTKRFCGDENLQTS